MHELHRLTSGHCNMCYTRAKLSPCTLRRDLSPTGVLKLLWFYCRSCRRFWTPSWRWKLGLRWDEPPHWVPCTLHQTHLFHFPSPLSPSLLPLHHHSSLSFLFVPISLPPSFPHLPSFAQCSAKDLHNVPETFYFAQKAVLYPTAPLYSPSDRQVLEQWMDISITQ